jgi:site-specific recombinase XerD
VILNSRRPLTPCGCQLYVWGQLEHMPFMWLFYGACWSVAVWCSILGMRAFQLIAYRRHQTGCPSFPGRTYFPATNTERKADTCQCLISADGYLKDEPKRITNLALGTSDWSEAIKVADRLVKEGRLPERKGTQPKTRPEGEITVKYAVDEYLKYCRRPHTTVGETTLGLYESFLRDRLLPWCKEQDVVSLKELEDLHSLRQFAATWKKLKNGVSGRLGINTYGKLVQEFSVFMNWCLENRWVAINLVPKLNNKRTAAATDDDADESGPRTGLEIAEYDRVLSALDNYPDNVETKRLRAFIELLRWTGMRLSDGIKFCRSELERNSTDTGWNANFIQWKLRKHRERARCISPVPDQLAAMLLDLPYTCEGQNKSPFVWNKTFDKNRTEQFWFDRPNLNSPKMHWYNAVISLFAKAQEEIPFKHHTTAHNLRHTFAIQKLNNGADINDVSSWVGHFDVATTIKHYSRPTDETRANRERNSMLAVLRERAKMEEFRMAS